MNTFDKTQLAADMETGLRDAGAEKLPRGTMVALATSLAIVSRHLAATHDTVQAELASIRERLEALEAEK